MKATLLARIRVPYTNSAFAELVLWRVPKPAPGSPHPYKYRLAYVVDGECVLRYDNEAGKGDHRHYRDEEWLHAFSTPEQLVCDFQADIERWNSENRDT